MTTYGTIPTAPVPPSSSTTFVARAHDRLRSGFSKRRPWTDLLPIRSISLPPSFNEALLRLRTNFAYFQTNYAIIILLVLFLSLLWHPISLIVFIIMMAAWLFLYFLRDEPLVVFSKAIDDRIVLAVLAVLTLVFLFLTDVAVNIVVALAVSVVLVVVHGVVRRIDDLPADEFDEEAAGAGIATGGYSRLRMKETASSSFSSAV